MKNVKSTAGGIGRILFLLFFCISLTGCGGIFDFLDAEMNRAIGKKDPKVCLKMNEDGDEDRKKRCLTAVAEEKKDPKVCDLIDDDIMLEYKGKMYLYINGEHAETF